ncbi:deleted in malignant brain tumors 1 protein-like isoform X2 [Anneissia japonica]|uniref:deleted in malignant brain tumors 1 protein-like isoform X2 n=1 Tax=Anneissia japonica TaxID=1529436 RepID=UPI0014258C18|nr:deleted in malignant brain tumors 1 protein-like isoform X2 [Anneissia japonica]
MKHIKIELLLLLQVVSCTSGTTVDYSSVTTEVSGSNVTNHFISPGGVQNITSPGYPSNYGNNVHYEWNLLTYPGDYIKLEFIDFRLESFYDYVVVESSGVTLVHQSGNTPPQPVVSLNNSMVITFTSDTSVTFRGFNAKVSVRHNQDGDIYTDFQAGFGGWTHGVGEMSWRRLSGNTPSYNTGPTNGHSGLDDDFYLYIETSSTHTYGDKARIISPTLQSKWTDFCVQFYYHMYGASINELKLWYHFTYYASVSNWFRQGSQGDKWHYGYTNFRNDYYHYDDVNNYVYFDAVAGNTYTGDIAIDDIFISGGVCHENQDSTTSPTYLWQTTDAAVPSTNWRKTTDAAVPSTNWRKTTDATVPSTNRRQTTDASSPITDLVQSDVICDDSYMTVYIGDSTLVDVTYFPPHLIDSDCTTFYNTYKNGMYWLVFVTRYDRCGTTVNFLDDLVEYSNAVYYKEVGNSTIISRETQHVLPVKCKLKNSGRSSINFDPQEVQLLGDDVEGSGNFSFTLDMYRESNFSTPYGNNDYPVVVDIAQTIYMGAHVTSYTGDIKLYIDYCVATPSSDENASPKYDLIENSCPSDDTTDFDEYKGDRTNVYFSFDSFRFVEHEVLVYVHCKMSVCNATDPACSRACNQRTKRAAFESYKNQRLTQGPFLIRRDFSREHAFSVDDPSVSGSQAKIPIIAVFFFVNFLFFVGIAVYKTKRRRTPKMHYECEQPLLE